MQLNDSETKDLMSRETALQKTLFNHPMQNNNMISQFLCNL